MTEVLTQPQKRIVSFSDACFHDPGSMVDGVNRQVNEWLDNGGVIIRDPQIIPQPSTAISENGRTSFFYVVSIVFVEDVSEIPDEQEGVHNAV